MPFAALLAAALSFAEGDAAFALSNATALVEAHPSRDAGTPGGAAAARWIRDRVRAEGGLVVLDGFSADVAGERTRLANVVAAVCRTPGRPWTVLVSHFDTKPGKDCPGANDGASTTGLLLALWRRVARTPAFKGNVLFVWTDAEECRGAAYQPDDGLLGSRRMADELVRLKQEVRSVVVLDMLGDADLRVEIPRNVTPRLARAVCQAAAECGFGVGEVAVSAFSVKDDHVPFLERGFEAVDLIDFSYGSAPGLNDYWHSPADTPDKLSAASLLKCGRLVAALLRTEADAADEGEKKEEKQTKDEDDDEE